MGRTRLVACALCVALPTSASAADDEWILALEPAWGLYDAQETHHGVGGQLSGWLGVTDAVWAFASVGGLYLPGAEDPVLEAGGGVVLALDVYRTIPFIEVAAGLNVLGDRYAPLLRLGVGADYLVTPSVSLGAVVRYRPLFGTLEREGLVSVGVRLGWRGEY